MKIKNDVIVALDQTDKTLFIPKNAKKLDYYLQDLLLVGGVDSIKVEEGNTHFYVQDGCLIWRKKKMLMLAAKGAKIPADGVEIVASGAFMRQPMKEVEVPACVKAIYYGAFSDTGLERVILHEGLELLDMGAFCGNEGLTELYIPKSVKKLVGNEILEQVESWVEVNYGKRTYYVYEDSPAHTWVQEKGLTYVLRKD